MSTRSIVAAVAAAGVLALGVSACSSSGTKDATSNANPPSSSAGTEPGSPSVSGSGSGGSAMSAPFGTACSAVPSSGAGSFSGMAQDPVATAASHNPALSTLVAAVQKAGLVDTLNSAKDITVFAPTNAAFAKIPKATLEAVLNDKAKLTKILTYHVVPGQLEPTALAGTHKTLEGGTLSVTGSGESFTVNSNAHVVCGNVHTANARVYIIDTVLMPSP